MDIPGGCSESPSVCQYRKKTETQIKTLLRCNLEVDLTDLSRLFPFSCCVDGLFVVWLNDEKAKVAVPRRAIGNTSHCRPPHTER